MSVAQQQRDVLGSGTEQPPTVGPPQQQRNEISCSECEELTLIIRHRSRQYGALCLWSSNIVNTANNLEENSGIFQPKPCFLNFVSLKLHKCFFLLLLSLLLIVLLPYSLWLQQKIRSTRAKQKLKI